MISTTRALRWHVLFTTIVFMAFQGCDGCDDDPTGGPDATTHDADVQRDGSVDGGCPSGITCGPYAFCCEAGEECVNNFQCLPICDNERCGDNLEECCDPGQICLDGVSCAADCPALETLCGTDLDTCCDLGDVCLNDDCITPGDICTNNFDCLDDGWYCEETIGRCLPLPPGPLCEGEGTFTDIEPALEWYWPGIQYGANYYQNILVAPTVGDVDGDGTPDVVVVVYQGSSYSTDNLIVVLSGDGDGAGNGDVLFTIPSASEPAAPIAYGLTSVALANFDADPGLEIVYKEVGGAVRIADNDGQGEIARRTTGTGATSNIWGGPTVADLDHDGMPDVIVQCHAMNGNDISDPALDFMDVAGCGANTVVADLNQDGLPEVLDAGHAITADPNVPGGDPFWTVGNTLTSGFIAVADILPAIPGPEVINIRSNFYLVDGQTGSVLIGPGGSVLDATIPIPGAGTGGAPTVADFDGDGLPEVSTAGLSAYVVYDPDCWNPPLRAGGQCASGSTDLMLWQTPTQDLSSSQTGSSVFDFQGDGPAEVLYNDECFFHIYDGTTGAELVDPIIPSSSRTAAEYPLVADVDGDGNAEMVIVSNQDQAISRDNCHISWKTAGVSIDWLCQYTTCTAGAACVGGVGGTCAAAGYQCDQNGICQLPGGTHGVRVYGDSHDLWVKTRPVWNQFAYHVTNFVLQGGVWDVPVVEVANWTTYNNYRQNVQGGALFPVPDLRLELTATPRCPGDIRLTAVVHNDGSAGAPAGVEVSFYRTDALAPNPPEYLDTMTTTTTILPGGWERLVLLVPVPAPEIHLTYSATTDASDTVEECDDLNNSADSEEVYCPGAPG